MVKKKEECQETDDSSKKLGEHKVHQPVSDCTSATCFYVEYVCIKAYFATYSDVYMYAYRLYELLPMQKQTNAVRVVTHLQLYTKYLKKEVPLNSTAHVSL